MALSVVAAIMVGCGQSDEVVLPAPTTAPAIPTTAPTSDATATPDQSGNDSGGAETPTTTAPAATAEPDSQTSLPTAEATSEAGTPSDGAAAATPDADLGTTPTPQSTPTPTVPPTPVPPTPLPTSRPDLQGSPFDLFVPEFGQELAVVGVRFDDILEVHSGPGENEPLVATLDPDAVVQSVGEARRLPRSIWYRVTLGSIDGWVGSRFVTRLGTPVDITASFGDAPIAAATMSELAQTLAQSRASTEPASLIAISQAPTTGPTATVTVDVVGLPDDAVGGERLRIVATSLGEGRGFVMSSVRAQPMCRRGVGPAGLCT